MQLVLTIPGNTEFTEFRVIVIFRYFRDELQNNTPKPVNINPLEKQPTYVAPSKIHGNGLFARKPIAKNSIIGWLRGRPCKQDGCYVLWISETDAIEVECDLRYINHADNPNACYYDDLSVVALRDIHQDEEITHDYSNGNC